MNAEGRGVPVVAGPLAGYEAAFRAYLSRSGYAQVSVRHLVRVMARASHWLEERGVTVGGLTSPLAAELEAGLPGAGPLLRFLRVVLAAIQGERRWGGCVVAGECGFRGGSGCGRVACDDTVSTSDKGRPSPDFAKR